MEKLKLTSEQEKKIIDHFTTIIDKVVKDRTSLDEVKLPEWWKRYEGDWSSKTKKDFPFKNAADFHVPFTTWATDAIDSRKFSSVFGGGQIFKVLGTTKGSRAAAPRITRYVNHYMKNKMKVAYPYSDWFLGSVVEGQRVLKTVLEKTIKEKMHFKTGMQNGMMIMLKNIENFFVPETKTKEVQKIVSTDVATTDFLWWPTSANSIKGASGVAQRLYLTKYEIEQRVETQGYISKNINKLKSPAGDDTKTGQESFYEKKEGFQTTTATEAVETYKPYEIWAQYKIDGQKEQEYVFVIDVNNRVLLAADYNRNRDKRRPYVFNYHRKIPKRMLGQGLPRRLSLMNDEMDTLHNIIIDNATLCNALTFLYVPGKSVDLEGLVMKPGQGIAVDSLEGNFKQLVLGNPNLNLQQQENFVLSLLERLALVSDYSLGRESSQTSRPTARGTAMILHELSMNFSKIAANCQQAVGEHVMQVLEILYEILPEEVEYYPDPNSEESDVFSRTDLEYIDDLEIISLGDAIAASKQLQVNNALTLYDSLGQDQTGEINTAGVKKNLVEKVDRNLTKDLVRDPKELQQLQQAQQMIQEKAEMLRQKEMELELKAEIIKWKAEGKTDEEIEVEVEKWQVQVMQEEQQGKQ
jgi:hypothetical protein